MTRRELRSGEQLAETQQRNPLTNGALAAERSRAILPPGCLPTRKRSIVVDDVTPEVSISAAQGGHTRVEPILEFVFESGIEIACSGEL